MADNSKQRIAVIAVSFVILVAMVVALTYGSLGKSPEDDHKADVSASMKAIKTICDSTDYKEVCITSLNSTAGNSTDPKELIEAAFQVTIMHLQEVVNKSMLLQNLQQDPRTKLALENCQELGDRAVSDIQNSFSMFQSFDFNNLKDMLNDMKVWISGAVTYQETCLDGFENTTGDAAEKMKQVLKTGMQLTSNGLAMITDVSSVITTLDISPSFRNRRLLSDDPDFPDWVDSKSRRLIDDVASINSTNPDLIVAKDGSGNYTTIKDALKNIPIKSNNTFILYIKEGVYEEKLTFFRNLTHLMVIGDGPTKTRITGSLNFIDGTPTYHTATVSALGEYFIAKDIGFENSAGPEKHQAVALRVGADKSIFYNCHMDGYQDTLYVHTYRQFYRNCVISGTIDFIFGDSAAVFQNCTLVVRKPLDNQQCIVTAQGRKDVRQPTGLVLQNCNIVADPAYHPLRKKIKSYLGRPWKEFSRTIIMETNIDDLIQPEGWLPWEGEFALNTLFYTEFNNRGHGSVKTQRVKWAGLKELQANRVQRYTASRFIEAETWIPGSGVPFDPDFIFPLPKENASVTYSPVEPEEVKDLGLPKEDNTSSELINGSFNMSPASLPTADVYSPPPLEGGVSPSPAPLVETIASPPLQGGDSPSPAPLVETVLSPPSPSPSTVAASPPLKGLTPLPSPSPSPSINAVSPTPERGAPLAPTPENAASPPAEGTTPPAPTPENAASPPTVGTTPPAPTPENSASPQTVGTTPPAQTPENAASPPTEGTTPPAPTPENAASPPAEGTTSPAPTPENTAPPPTETATTSPPAPTPENAASPPTEAATTPPAPTPQNAASPPTQDTTPPPAPTPDMTSAPPPTQDTTPPAPTPDVNSAPPPTQDTTPPAPAPLVNSAPPPVEGGNLPAPPQSAAAESTPPSPSSTTETSPPQSSPTVSDANVNSPSQSPSSQ